jgi:type VII secretion protein EccB
MARDPVTRMQLDAYRFGQRRVESALARRDPVLLHEEVRGQRRVVITGLVLAMLALAGTFAYAKLTGKQAWDQHQIVAAKQSGQMYAVIRVPEARLVPVQNLAAARLVLAAVGRVAGGRAGTDGQAEPVFVDDTALHTAPRTAAAAVPGAAATLPAAGKPLPNPGAWAVCDTVEPRTETIVVAGAAAPTPLPDAAAVLLRSAERDLYLVTGNRRYRLEDETELLRAYDLVDAPQRTASDALLSAVPEGRALRVPAVPGAGATRPDWLAARVGEVVRVADTAGDQHYLVLAGGVQAISRPVANLLRTAPGIDRSEEPSSVRAEQVNAVNRARVAGLDEYPGVMPRTVAGPDGRAVCWQWGVNGKGGVLSVGREPGLPPGRTRTELARADGPRPNVDAVSVPPGAATVVRGVSGRDGGGLWLISDTGVGYLVAAGQNGGNETATALGIQPESAAPAPDQVLRLLPAGPVLDLQAALHTVDGLVGSGETG